MFKLDYHVMGERFSGLRVEIKKEGSRFKQAPLGARSNLGR